MGSARYFHYSRLGLRGAQPASSRVPSIPSADDRPYLFLVRVMIWLALIVVSWATFIGIGYGAYYLYQLIV